MLIFVVRRREACYIYSQGTCRGTCHVYFEGEETCNIDLQGSGTCNVYLKAKVTCNVYLKGRGACNVCF